MGEIPFAVVTRKVFGLIASSVAQIDAINKKYAHAHLRTTPVIKVALLMLQIYVLSLVGVIIYKFVSYLR